VALRRGSRHQITLSDGACLHADHVILALGGIGGQAKAEQRAHADFAPQADGSYLPPAYPGDADLDRLPAGAPVIVAGLGLTFIDIMALVTQGRGGRFERDREGRLRYLAGGREPVLHVGSRRGVPYLPKPGQRLAGLEPGKPRFCTADRIADILATSATPGPDLVACIVQELAWAYYRELFSGHPGLTRCSWAAFAERYDALAITDPVLWRLIEQTVPDPADRLDLKFLRPLAGRRFDAQRALNQWMCRRIDATVRRATSMRHSPNAALMLALVNVGEQLELLLRGQTAPARGAGLARLAVFTSFVGSGPPPHRLEQLVALSDAGVVNFLGASLAVGHDREHGLFIATSGTLATPVFARHFVEARLPDPDIRSGADPLLAGLGADGRRLRSDPVTFQVLDASGQPVPRLLAMGPFASGGALGSLSRPCRDAIFFRQNDAVARWLLRECAVGVGNSLRCVSGWYVVGTRLVRSASRPSPRSVPGSASAVALRLLCARVGWPGVRRGVRMASGQPGDDPSCEPGLVKQRGQARPDALGFLRREFQRDLSRILEPDVNVREGQQFTHDPCGHHRGRRAALVYALQPYFHRRIHLDAPRAGVCCPILRQSRPQWSACRCPVSDMLRQQVAARRHHVTR
jgi:hypothetical protein